MLKLEFVLVLAAEIIQILYLIYKIPHIWKIWDWSKSLNQTLSNDLVCLILREKKTSWGTMYNECTCIHSHTCLGWGPDLQSSFECYWWLKLDEGKIKIENWSRDTMLRTFTILMLGLFQADASIWFVNYEKYILGFQSLGEILTFIISSHSQWTSIFISVIIWCFLTFPTSRCDPAHGKCVGWGLGLGIGKYWYLGLWGDLKVNIWKKEWWSATGKYA